MVMPVGAPVQASPSFDADYFMALIGEQTRKRRRGLDGSLVDEDDAGLTWEKLAQFIDSINNTITTGLSAQRKAMYLFEDFLKANTELVAGIMKYNKKLQPVPEPNEFYAKVLENLNEAFQKETLWNRTKDESLTLTLFRYGLFDEDWARSYVFAQAFDDDKLQEIRDDLERDDDGELEERYVDNLRLLRDDAAESRLQEDLYPYWYDQMVLAGPEAYERMVKVIEKVFGSIAPWNREDSLEED